MGKPGYIYLMASGRNGTTYLGVTSDLLKRVWQHRNEVIDSFSKNMAAPGWSGTRHLTIFSKRVSASCK